MIEHMTKSCYSNQVKLRTESGSHLIHLSLKTQFMHLINKPSDPSHLPDLSRLSLSMVDERDVFSAALIFYCTQRLGEFLSVQTQLLQLFWMTTKAAKEKRKTGSTPRFEGCERGKRQLAKRDVV